MDGRSGYMIGLVATILIFILIIALTFNPDGTVNLVYSYSLFGKAYFSTGKSGVWADNPKHIDLKPFHVYRVRMKNIFYGEVVSER